MQDKNIYLIVTSQIFGYIYSFLWQFADFSMLYVMFKAKSSKGLSKNFTLIHMTGFQLLMFNDSYGFFYDKSSYSQEVHISDIILSFNSLIAFSLCTVFALVVPCDSVNTYSRFVIGMCISWILIWQICWPVIGIEHTTIINAIIKQSASILCCFPQYLLIYRLKSTNGFSMFGIYLDNLGCIFAMAQLVIDYYMNGYQNDLGFWNGLNWGKFLANVMSFLAQLVLCYQHWWYTYVYKPKNKEGEEKILEIA